MRLKVELFHESAVHLQRALASLQSYWKDCKLILQFDSKGMKIYPRLQDISVVHFGFLFQISVSRELSAHNSIPTVLDQSTNMSAPKPFFREYTLKVSSQEQLLKFEIRNCAELLEALRVVITDNQTVKMIRLKKTDNRAEYHARLVFLELQETPAQNLETNGKGKHSENVLVTSSILKVNIENPKHKNEVFPSLFQTDYPLSEDLTSENENCLYIMSPLLAPLIKDYLGSMMSKDQMYCTIYGMLTNSKYSMQFDDEDEQQELKEDKNEEERVTIAIEGKGTANVFEKLSRRLAIITADGKFNQNFELCLGQRDFEALNSVVTKLTIGLKPVSAVIKHKASRSCYKIHLVLDNCENLQVVQVGKTYVKEEFEK